MIILLVVLVLASLPATATADSTCGIPSSGLVGWWRGDGNALDSAGTNHGSLAGGTGFASGAVGQAFSLDGVDDRVEIAHSPALDFPGSFTVAAWITTTTSMATQFIVSKYECGGFCPSVATSLYRLGVSGGRLYAIIRDTDGSGPPETIGGQELVGRTLVADGRLHHVAMVRDLGGGMLRLYVDGRLDASAPLNAGADGASGDDGEADPLLIGATIRGGQTTRESFFSGRIDEVTLFSRALSTAELAGMSACRVPPTLEVGISCPATLRRGETFTATIALTNRTDAARTVTGGALAFHAGELKLAGPTSLALSGNVPSGVADPPACAGCGSSVAPVRITTPPILLPAGARPVISVGIGVLGRVGTDARRRLLGTDACLIEVTASESRRRTPTP